MNSGEGAPRLGQLLEHPDLAGLKTKHVARCSVLSGSNGASKLTGSYMLLHAYVTCYLHVIKKPYV